ncbi:MAG: alpha/beta fold hydrolase [Duncaniella sp.]|nr:alpha/beta fold hydrolase [Duncaniella sp.]
MTHLISKILLSATFLFPAIAVTGAEKEVEIINHHDGINLAGTLSTPDSVQPKAVIVLASGSGQQNRDEEMLGHRPFKAIADYLTANGYAVLRMDDRGIGGSGGDFHTATADDFLRDISVALAYTDSCFAGIPTGVIGHSEGGTIAIRSAATDVRCEFIVTLAAPAWEGDSIVMSQSRALATAMTGRWDGEKLQRSILDIAKSDTPLKQANTMIYMSLAESLGEQAKVSAVQQQLAAQVEGVLSPWYRSMLRYNPSDDIKVVNKPWLALNGSLDTQVLPGNLDTISELNPGAIIKLLPGHNHLFQRCKTGLVHEYENISEDISPETLEMITKWLDGLFAREDTLER